VNIALILSFDGSDFNGFQVQKNAPSVQACLEKSLSILLNEKIKIIGCGRTDTGVSAINYCINFNYTVENLATDFCYKLNKILPNSIAVYYVYKVNNEFNARFDAIDRTYKYKCTLVKNPFLKHTHLQLSKLPNIETINDAATYLLGTHDFKSFSKVKTEVNNYKCTVLESHWKLYNDELIYTIKANRFLRNMVRAIVGTLLDIGLEKREIQSLNHIMAAQDRCKAGKSVQAHGLSLEMVNYDKTNWQLLQSIN